MEWDAAYAVGQNAVDSDHQRLFALFNQFSNAVQAGESRASANRFLTELVDYSETHFRREEGLMRKLQYPDYEKHKKMHDTFAAYVRKLASDAQHSDEEIAFLQNYVEMWLCGHILVMDKWFGEWLAEHRSESATGAPIS